MRHAAQTDSIIERHLATLDDVTPILLLVPQYLSWPENDNEHLRWLEIARILHHEIPDQHAVAEIVAIYAARRPFLLGDQVIMAEPKQINFSAAPKPGECSAKRCPETIGLSEHVIDGRTVRLCGRHVELCKASGQISGSPQPPAPSVDVGVFVAPPTIDAELMKVSEEAQADLKEVRAFRIESQDHVNAVAEILSKVHGKINELEARRTQITQPMNVALRSVNDLFRPPMDTLREISGVLKAEVKRFEAESADRNRAAMEEAARIVAVGGDPAPALAKVALVANAEDLSLRRTWKYRVTDENLVPREFMKVDTAKLQVLAVSIRPEIPGIEWFQDIGVSVTAS